MCFSLEWIEQVFILAIVIVAVVALLRLLVSFLAPRLGMSDGVIAFIVEALRIVLWAIVGIFAVIFIFGLCSCLISWASWPSLLPHR